MAATSAGLLLFRHGPNGVEVLLAHPGGPFWARKDDGAWSIPKGAVEDGEAPVDAARRETAEELGAAPEGALLALGEIRQSGGKRVHAWAAAFDFDPAALVSNTFTMEWPPRSGREQAFPEVDRAEWFDMATARRKMLKSQLPLLDALVAVLAAADDAD